MELLRPRRRPRFPVGVPNNGRDVANACDAAHNLVSVAEPGRSGRKARPRAADRWCRVSISDLERHQLKLLRARLGLDPPANAELKTTRRKRVAA